MSDVHPPKGMISVEDFSKRKGIPKEKIIAMIKDGFYAGSIVGVQWFVEAPEQSTKTGRPTNSDNVACH